MPKIKQQGISHTLLSTERMPGVGRDEACGAQVWVHPRALLYLSTRAKASGSVGGMMKQTAGALSFFPVLSVSSQLSPLFFCRV